MQGAPRPIKQGGRHSSHIKILLILLILKSIPKHHVIANTATDVYILLWWVSFRRQFPVNIFK